MFDELAHAMFAQDMATVEPSGGFLGRAFQANGAFEFCGFGSMKSGDEAATGHCYQVKQLVDGVTGCIVHHAFFSKGSKQNRLSESSDYSCPSFVCQSKKSIIIQSFSAKSLAEDRPGDIDSVI